MIIDEMVKKELEMLRRQMSAAEWFALERVLVHSLQHLAHSAYFKGREDRK